MPKHIMLYIFTIILALFLASCTSEFEPRKAVFNFNASDSDYDAINLMLEEIAKNNAMSLKDNSYKYGTEDAPQTRLIVHLKNSDNLEIYTDCYSDWQKCSLEFICFSTCSNWKDTVNLFENKISKKWPINHVYKNESISEVDTNDT